MRYQVGDTFPNIPFQTATQTNQQVYDHLENTTIFWVLRYIGCTVCRLDIQEIAKKYDQFLEKNAKVYVVLQSDQAHVQKDLEDHPLPFEIICDPKMKFYEELDVRPAKNKLELAGNVFQTVSKLRKTKKEGLEHGDYEGNELQLPALFIVSSDHKIQYAHYAKSISDMPSVEEVLQKLG